VAAWPEVVGAEIARSAWPARFQRDGTLVVHTRDAIWAFELTQRAAEIQQRMEGVTALKFVPGPLPEPLTEQPPATPQGPPPPSSEHSRKAAEWAARIDDEDLRKIVTKAVEMSLARTANDRSF
jgi:predicted nucleic acid-binding Zn ribbon protein